MHRSEIRPAVRERIMQRRGRLHIHDAIDPARAALLVVDMQTAFVAPDRTSGVAHARGIVPNINRLAGAFRAAGGRVVWVTSTFSEQSLASWSAFFGGVYSLRHSAEVIADLSEGAEGHQLWPELEVRADDWRVVKDRFSAFIQGASDIETRLRAAGIDMVVITGTLTNVCCESTARDAMMRNFRVVMVADANAALSDDDHNASLTAVAGTFGDVMTVDEVIDRLSPARAEAAVR